MFCFGLQSIARFVNTHLEKNENVIHRPRPGGGGGGGTPANFG